MPIMNGPLSADGAIIDIAVGVSESRRQTLLSAGKAVPSAIVIRALVDTGASTTHVVGSVIQPLGLTTTGPVPVITASTGSKPVMFDEFEVSVLIVHPELAKIFDLVPVLACEPLSNDYEALLGCDLLKYCTLFFNGPKQTFSLAF